MWIIIILIIIVLILSFLDLSAKINERSNLIKEYCKKQNAVCIKTNLDNGCFVAENSVKGTIIIGFLDQYKVIKSKIADQFKISSSFGSFSNVWNFVAFDHSSHKMLVADIEVSKEVIRTEKIAYCDIVGVEMLQNGISIFSKSTRETKFIDRDLTTQNNITSLSLKILTRDVKEPIVQINWWKSFSPEGSDKKEIEDYYDPLIEITETIVEIINNKGGSKN